MAHLVQAAVWTAGLDDRLTDSGLISFQLSKAYAPPVGVKGQISTVCLYTAGGNLASNDNFIPVSYTHLDVYKRQIVQRGQQVLFDIAYLGRILVKTVEHESDMLHIQF